MDDDDADGEGDDETEGERRLCCRLAEATAAAAAAITLTLDLPCVLSPLPLPSSLLPLLLVAVVALMLETPKSSGMAMLWRVGRCGAECGETSRTLLLRGRVTFLRMRAAVDMGCCDGVGGEADTTTVVL